jgi:MFS family permease
MESAYWRQNLFVCLFGSFTTIACMTMLLPFLPLYVAELGVSSPQAVVEWSGVAYGATFLSAGLLAPVWGRLADRYGRKLILIRASLGMAVAITLIGLAQNIHQLVLLRLLTGALGGYASGAVVLVATQTPKARVGWALGTLSTGSLAGSLTGPLIGGVMPDLIGLRGTFFAGGAVIFVAFLATVLLVREERRPVGHTAGPRTGIWASIPDRRPVLAMLLTAMMLMVANMSIEPIITVYVAELAPGTAHVALLSGIVMAVSALASILAAPRLGRLADRIGAWRVIILCLAVSSVLLVPQAFAREYWQLVVLRFLMGLSLAGLLPAIAAQIRHSVPDQVTGTMLGFSTSAQYAGQVSGPLVGGLVGGQVGMRWVFAATAVLMAATAVLNVVLRRRCMDPAALPIADSPG